MVLTWTRLPALAHEVWERIRGRCERIEIWADNGYFPAFIYEVCAYAVRQ